MCSLSNSKSSATVFHSKIKLNNNLSLTYLYLTVFLFANEMLDTNHESANLFLGRWGRGRSNLFSFQWNVLRVPVIHQVKLYFYSSLKSGKKVFKIVL